MKTDRHGQAKILTSDEIKKLFEMGFTCDLDRALFGICLYTACRIKEACTPLAHAHAGRTQGDEADCLEILMLWQSLTAAAYLRR